eukprot:CAMPEP_0206299004 /NCGR_PEP_ID=MMETSP0106_2-20121207/6972_1 /ASSEMBLY_ACC=CAM_ASM_000206 /TAXON_ID=81532 /ORGANISM="Acanthoeca-like sp., Strain 10tr" /LENGTH=186 /DNA_ID=CAMNT_0053729703 /DNA_START=184 /DNA_END=744 /DNA_ORIENTATION=-
MVDTIGPNQLNLKRRHAKLCKSAPVHRELVHSFDCAFDSSFEPTVNKVLDGLGEPSRHPSDATALVSFDPENARNDWACWQTGASTVAVPRLSLEVTVCTKPWAWVYGQPSGTMLLIQRTILLTACAKFSEFDASSNPNSQSKDTSAGSIHTVPPKPFPQHQNCSACRIAQAHVRVTFLSTKAGNE